MYSYSLYSIQRWNRIFQLYISQYSNSVGTKYNINIISIILSIDDDLTFSSHWLERRWWSVDQLKPLITGLDRTVTLRLIIANLWVHSTALSSLSKSVQFYREEPSQTPQDWMINTVFTFYFTEQSSRHFPEAQVIKESDLRSWHLHWVFTVLCF